MWLTLHTKYSTPPPLPSLMGSMVVVVLSVGPFGARGESRPQCCEEQTGTPLSCSTSIVALVQQTIGGIVEINCVQRWREGNSGSGIAESRPKSQGASEGISVENPNWGRIERLGSMRDPCCEALNAWSMRLRDAAGEEAHLSPDWCGWNSLCMRVAVVRPGPCGSINAT
jgi:hypothetical protein